MTLTRARIVKDASSEGTPTGTSPSRAERAFGRRVPREVVDAAALAERIVADAKDRADAIVAAARNEAARVASEARAEAREEETARLAAAFLALRRADEERAERDLARAVDLAMLLAERLVGEGLRFEPARVAELAASALAETRGARRIRVDACPDDVDALRAALAAVGHVADVAADPELTRGSLVVHTDLGVVDARLRPQLARLAHALKEALR